VSSNKDNDVVASRVGQFQRAPVAGGFSGLMKSGQLIQKYCVDRTQVLVPDHFRVAEVASYYIEAGCDVRTLDEGSCYSEVVKVQDWLVPAEAVCPRILVVSEVFGIGHNFPLAYVITSATKVVFPSDKKGGLLEEEVPLREIDVFQHIARTGRGMAHGSGGIVASAEVDKSLADLSKSEALEAYLGLVAADIRPRAGMFDEVRQLIPKGLTRDVALEVLSVALPPALVLRYLGSDGRIAARFSGAMELFVQPDHRLTRSVDVDPVGYKDWVSESLGGYYGRPELVGASKVMVPFPTTRLLRVAMHMLYAVSMKWFVVDRWRPEGDGYVSEDEQVSFVREKASSPVVAPRLVVEQGVEERKEESEVRQWAYDVAPEVLARRKKRNAMSWLHDSRADMAVSELRERAEKGLSFGMVTSDIRRYLDEGAVSRVELRLPQGRVDLESPGGSVVVRIAEVVFDALVSGEALSEGFFLDVLGTYKAVGDKFVKSTLFDNWSAPWLSVLRTYCQDSVVEYAIRKNYGSRLTRLLGELYDRFRVEAIGVCTTSNLYKGKFSGVFGAGAPSTSRLERLIKKGKLPIAQSDKFIRRFLSVKEAHAEATMALERCGLFVPHIVTKQQKRFPVRKRGGILPVVGESVVEQEENFRVV